MPVRPCPRWGLLLAAAVSPAMAQSFTSSNLQLLYGHGFDDRITGANTRGRDLGTVTFENLAVRDWGDSFLFVDVYHGPLLDYGGARRGRSGLVYGEWDPRLSLAHLSGRERGSGLVRDVFLAGQVNAGDDGFRAGLIGLGADFNLPGFQAFGVNLYRRDDSFNAPTAQLTVFWTAALGERWLSEGFLDLAGTDHAGTDAMFQPRLLLDVGAGLGEPRRWYAGIEWYYHHSGAVATSAPQLMLKAVLP